MTSNLVSATATSARMYASSSSTINTIPAAFASTMSAFQQRSALVGPAFFSKLRHESNLAATTTGSFDTNSSFSEEPSEMTRLNGNKSLRRQLNVELTTSLNRNPWIVGHRGCLYQELENTRPGFAKCADMGADAVELDVFVLKCGTLIVFHGGGSDENPGTLDDYCGVQGKSILDLTYQQALNELTFNPDFAEFPCPTSSILAGQIPTLEQVLEDAKQSGLHVKIELKGPGTVEPSLEVVERLDMLNQCSFSSFDLERLAYFRELRPDTQDYQTGALFFNVPDDYIQQAQACGATEIHLRYDTCTFDVITAIHEAGFGSMAWCRGPIGMGHDCLERFWDVGNEDESMYEALLRTGVQQLCINKPDVLIGLRTKLLLQSVQQSDTNDETTPSFVQQETPGQIEASA